MIILPVYQSQAKKRGINPISSKLNHSELSQSCSGHAERQRLQRDLAVAPQYLTEHWVLMVLMKKRERDLSHGERVTGPGAVVSGLS